jgi:hypothetical protein
MGLGVGAVGEVVGAELDVGLLPSQDVPNDADHVVGDSEDRLGLAFAAEAAAEALVLGAEVGRSR